MPEATNTFREPLNRALTEEERDLVRWLVDHSFVDNATHLLPQIERLSVISKCTCGCAAPESTLFQNDCFPDTLIHTSQRRGRPGVLTDL